MRGNGNSISGRYGSYYWQVKSYGNHFQIMINGYYLTASGRSVYLTYYRSNTWSISFRGDRFCLTPYGQYGFIRMWDSNRNYFVDKASNCYDHE